MADNILNNARWDDNVRQWSATGGPSYSTTIVSIQNGNEQRAANWINSRGSWNLGDRGVPMAKYQKLLSFFHRVQGKFIGFRIRDWTDYSDDGRGVLGTGVGNGDLSYQMNKLRSIENVVGSTYQKITRPVGTSFAASIGNTIKIYQNGLEIPQGGGQGSCFVNDETGVVVFNPYTFEISSAVGDTITFTSPHNLSVGEWIKVQGYVGEGETNNGFYQVTGTFGSNAVTVNRTGMVGGPGATALNLPGPTDTITWTGQYDIPARFDIDSFSNQIEAFIEGGDDNKPENVWVRLSTIPVVQLRE